MEMRLPTYPVHSAQSAQPTQNRPFTFGGNPTFGIRPAMGCVMKPHPQVKKNNDSDSEDDFPVQQAGPVVNTPQFARPGGMGIQFGGQLGGQLGQIKSNQMLYTQLKEMRTQVEQTNKVIDGFYQILSMPNELDANQIEQLYLQIETMRNNIIANNNSINEIYRIIVKS